MKAIKTISDNNFNISSHTDNRSEYYIRQAARAILYDDSSRIAIIHVSNQGYYKLPGGGIDPEEDVYAALRRELLEEVGASSIEIISEIGRIDEYRDEYDVKGEHFGFIAKITGEIVDPSRTEKEITNGHEVVWAQNIDEAISLVESGRPAEYGPRFEKLRELTFLHKAKKINKHTKITSDK